MCTKGGQYDKKRLHDIFYDIFVHHYYDTYLLTNEIFNKSI